MDKCAIFAYVSNTQLSQYDDRATRGVARVASDIISQIKPAFRNNLWDLGPKSTVATITRSFSKAANELKPKGFLLFYFHGHGDSIVGRNRKDEEKDQALVCYDNYLLDDVIDELLSKFQPTHRILTIVDSCSAETVIEWSKYSTSNYPEIIHIASSNDGGVAYASIKGGFFSRKILDLVYESGYANYTYATFISRLRWQFTHSPFIERTSENVTPEFEKTKLFK